MLKRLSIFTTVKPFYKAWGDVQFRAMRSWTRITPRPEIILYGDAYGARAASEALDVVHVPLIQRNQYEAPYLSTLFEDAYERCSEEIRVFVPCDVILPLDFSEYLMGVEKVFEQFLLVGRSCDIPPEFLQSFDKDLEGGMPTSTLISQFKVAPRTLRSKFFAFRKTLGSHIPPLAVGGLLWDNWIVCDALCRDIPVIDSSDVIASIHQSHGYDDNLWGSRERRMASPETRMDAEVAPETLQTEFMSHADRKLLPDGQILKTRMLLPPELERARAERKGAALKIATRLREEGMRLDKEGRSAQGLIKIEKAHEICPELPGAQLFRAICLLNLKRYSESIAAAETLLVDAEFSDQAQAIIQIAQNDLGQILLQ